MPWPDRIEEWREYIEAAASATGLLPELIGAVMDRESNGGDALRPRGPGGTGDYGHGHGLMQIDDRTWGSWLATNDWEDPGINILFGANLLNANLKALGGDIPAAVAAYNCGLTRVLRLKAHVALTIPELDELTTGGNYVSDVLNRLADFQEPDVELSG